MVQARRHLTKHGKLGCLDQLMLGFPELIAGFLPLADFIQKLLVGTLKLRRSAGDAALKLLSPVCQFSLPPIAFPQIQRGEQADHEDRHAHRRKPEPTPQHGAGTDHHLKRPVQTWQRCKHPEVFAAFSIVVDTHGPCPVGKPPG